VTSATTVGSSRMASPGRLAFSPHMCLDGDGIPLVWRTFARYLIHRRIERLFGAKETAA